MPRASLARSLPAVYAAAAVRVAFPLIVLPVMASRLGPEEFGRLGLCLVWASLLAVLAEGGFVAAATRRAVVADAAQRRDLAQQVFSARCVLGLPVILIGLVAGGWLIPGVGASLVDRLETALLIPSLACAYGWAATWYLQGTSQLHRWAWIELSVQLLLLLACLGMAYSVVVYMVLQSAAAAVLVVLGWRWVRREVMSGAAPLRGGAGINGVPSSVPGSLPRGLWSTPQLKPGLQLGFTMLPVSLIGSVYSLGLPAVAAAQLGRSELGLYYLADRAVRAMVASTDPLMQLVYPRIVERFVLSPRAALAYALRWAAAGLLAGLAIGLAVWLLWPWVEVLASGVDTERLRPVVAVLGWLLPLGMGWRFIGYWMLGSGRYDRTYRGCIVVGAIVGLGGAWWLGRSAVSLAGVALTSEVAVMLAAGLGVLLTEWLRRR